MPENLHDQIGKHWEMGCSVELLAGSWVREDVLPQCFPVDVPCKAAELGQSPVCLASACKAVRTILQENAAAKRLHHAAVAPVALHMAQGVLAVAAQVPGVTGHDLTFLATSCAISSQSTTETLCCLSIVTTVLLPQAMPPVKPTSNIAQLPTTRLLAVYLLERLLL